MNSKNTPSLSIQVSQEIQLEQVKQLPLKELVHQIQVQHQDYLTRWIPEIEQAIDRFRETNSNPSIQLLLKFHFEEFKQEFLEHLFMEDRYVLPVIKSHLIHSNLSMLQSVVDLFMDQHSEKAQESLFTIHQRMSRHFPELNQHISFRMLQNKLQLFFEELEFHHLIEETILLSHLHQLLSIKADY